jgi:ATP-binding cassette subfamily C protein
MLRTYLMALLSYGHGRIALAFSLMLLAGMTEGIGLLMLVPFLHLLGLSGSEGAPSGITALAAQAFGFLGLPMTLPAVLLVYIALIVVRALFVGARDVLLAAVRLGFVDALRVRLYTAVGRANWLFLSKRRMADLTQALTSDIDRVGSGTYYLLTLTLTTLMATVHVGAALTLSAPMTLIALVTGGSLAFLLLPQIRRARRLGEQLTEADRTVYRAVTEFLGGIKLAKSYGAEDRHREIFSDAVAGYRRRELSYIHSNTFARSAYQIGAALILAGLLLVAAHVVALPGAELLVLVLVFARLLPMLSRLQLDYQQIVHMLPAFASVVAMTRAFEDAAEHLPEASGVGGIDMPLSRDIQLRKVTFHYDENSVRAALDRIDLIIPARLTTALVGPSGAGKSTLADLLMGLLRPGSGEVLVDGRRLTDRDVIPWRRHVAYVPQETFLFHDTVRANLQWAQPGATDAEIWRALEHAAADGFVGKLPAGLDTVLGERGVRLAGGERQRLALARALLSRPLLLILDEATSALDTEHERRIQQAVDNMHGELTIVVIAHRLSTVRHADQIVVLEQGRVVETGSWQGLCDRNDGRLRALLEAQS